MRELENNLITFSDMLLEKVLRGCQRRAMSIADTELLSHLLAWLGKWTNRNLLSKKTLRGARIYNRGRNE